MIKLPQFWYGLSIIRKFRMTFGILMTLVIVILMTSIGTLTVILYQSRMAIQASNVIVPLVWEMDRNLNEARHMQNDFLAAYPKEGFDAAYDLYVERVYRHVDLTLDLLMQLKEYASETQIKKAIETKNVNLNLYLSSAQRYKTTFDAFLINIEILAHDDTGLLFQMEQKSRELLHVLEEIKDQDLIILYYRMNRFVSEYKIKTLRPVMHSAFNQGFILREQLKASPASESPLYRNAILILQEYEDIAQRILDVNSEIKGVLSDFKLQEELVKPISEELIALVKLETETIRIQIDQINRIVITILLTISIAGTAAASVIVNTLNRSITSNILELTNAALHFKKGELDYRLEDSGKDELGQLADTLNAMRFSLKEKIDHLGQEIAERERAELRIRELNRDLELRVIERTEELQNAKEFAESANNAKSIFLAHMSYELRTPLNSILGYAQILKRDDQFAGHKGIDIIHNSGKYLLALINDILDLAKVESGKMELDCTPFLLQPMLEDVLSLIMVRAQKKNLYLDYEAFSDIPHKILGDEKRLRQILINLLGNAVKFTETGGINLTVEIVSYCRIQNQPGVVLRFAVIDTGIGIAQDQISSVFNQFEQVGGIKQNIQGTGLGLTITRQLVTMMGGEISVDSEPGRGTSFYMNIPFRFLGKIHNERIYGSAVQGYKGGLKNILIVDDNKHNRLVLSDMLKPLGFQVTTLSSGAECLDQYNQISPDMILLDLMMPEMTGYEVVERIRTSEDQAMAKSPVVIIAVSASVFDMNPVQLKAAGFDDYLSKPIEENHMFDAISRHLNLEWIYKPESIPAENIPLLLPSENDLIGLKEKTVYHDYDGLEEELVQLIERNPHYAPFVEKIRKWSKDFDMEKIKKFLDKSL